MRVLDQGLSRVNTVLYRTLLLLGLTTVLVTSAYAVVLRPIHDDELVQRATYISLSEVVDVQSFWRDGRILSWIELRAIRVFRGHEQRVRILVPGGRVGHLTQVVPGGPAFEPGAQRLFFLEPLTHSRGFRLVGFNHGAVSGEEAERFARLMNVVSTLPKPQNGSQLEHRP